MTTITIKRVYEAPAPSDGLRILVDRLWPRGLAKAAAALDLWCKDLAPSSELRVWFDHRPERFAQFGEQYRAELAGNPAVAEALGRISGARATLLYAARDPQINHAVVLSGVLRLALKQ